MQRVRFLQQVKFGFETSKKFKFHKLDNIAIGEKAFLLKLNSNLIWFWQAVESDGGEDDNCQASLIHRQQFFAALTFFNSCSHHFQSIQSVWIF